LKAESRWIQVPHLRTATIRGHLKMTSFTYAASQYSKGIFD
jgi:hypothetical protein